MTIEHIALRYETRSQERENEVVLSAANQTVPLYFQGAFRHPRRAADMLLTLCSVVGHRFYTPPQMVAKRVRESDPVITCGQNRLRWEAFSTCCSVYARIDHKPEALTGALLTPGTTNVDMGPESRAALSKIGSNSDCKLTIASSGLELSGGTTLQEKSVRLPKRWLRSFVEAQYHQHSMKPFVQLNRPQLRRFLEQLPASSSRSCLQLEKSRSGLRAIQRSSKVEGAVSLQGWERLKLLNSLLVHSESLDIYSNPQEASTWQLNCQDSSFTLVLSPTVQRGFSGEGQALFDMISQRNSALEQRLSEELAKGFDLNLQQLQDSIESSKPEIVESLARLSTLGRVGLDLTEKSYFGRTWDLDLGAVQLEHPRIQAAQKLRPNVRWEAGRAVVKSGDICYFVSWNADQPKCQCPWYQKHQLSRGACKHILAAQWSLYES